MAIGTGHSEFLNRSLSWIVSVEEQRSFLAHEGCKEGQGYLFAKPVALKDLLQSIASRGVKPEQAVERDRVTISRVTRPHR